MEWSKEKGILGRGPCKNKDTEGLGVFLFGGGFVFIFIGVLLLCGAVSLLCNTVNAFKQRCYWHFGQDCYRMLPSP